MVEPFSIFATFSAIAALLRIFKRHVYPWLKRKMMDHQRREQTRILKILRHHWKNNPRGPIPSYIAALDQHVEEDVDLWKEEPNARKEIEAVERGDYYDADADSGHLTSLPSTDDEDESDDDDDFYSDTDYDEHGEDGDDVEEEGSSGYDETENFSDEDDYDSD